jgi:integrase
LKARLQAVEALHDLSQYTTDKMPSYPWPDDSAWNLAGLTGQKRERKLRGGKTPLIPDQEFSALFQAAWGVVQQAPYLLDLRDKLEAIEADETLSRTTSWSKRCALLESNDWKSGVAKFHSAALQIRTACYIVVASLSGCRNHELAFVHSDATYRTVDNEGEEYWWMRSTSTKTGEGKTEWMIPLAAAEALKVMDRWAIPYQKALLAEIEGRREQNPNDVEIAEAQRHLGAIFVGRDPKGGQKGDSQVRTLSDRCWNRYLRAFASAHGIAWKFATHQFRRKFANYAARSQFGDLRYLKEHFKHWSFDMTLGYAMNEFQEVALYSEVYDELADLKEGVVSDWMGNIEPLAGGLGQRVMEWRGSNDVTLFKDHKSMVKTLAEGFGNLRSNGHAWCTADQGIDCIGNGGLDRTRCTGCDHAVIGRIHAKVYQGLYDQLSETLRCNDIGEGGRAYVQRSLDRCASVLKALGHEPNRGTEQ